MDIPGTFRAPISILDDVHLITEALSECRRRLAGESVRAIELMGWVRIHGQRIPPDALADLEKILGREYNLYGGSGTTQEVAISDSLGNIIRHD